VAFAHLQGLHATDRYGFAKNFPASHQVVAVQRHRPGALFFATGSISVTINSYSWGGHHASPRFEGASDRFGFASYFLPFTHVCIAHLVSILTTLLGPFLSDSAVAGGDLAEYIASREFAIAQGWFDVDWFGARILVIVGNSIRLASEVESGDARG
jgi:hypothetical protein